MMNIVGRVWKYGDDVNTDVIFPGKYTYTVTEEAEMAKHALEDLDPSFAAAVRPGDIIVGGKNWGCGSSRQQAVTCLKVSGIAAVVVKGVSRIYYRNAINEALPVIVCPEAVDNISEGDSVDIDLSAGIVKTKRGKFTFKPFPAMIMDLIEEGGLVNYVNASIARGEK